MNTFPVMLILEGRLAAVIGGGAVGLRKARALREAGCRVRLVSPVAVSDELDEGVEVICAPYAPEHLDEVDLVFACTSSSETNDQIARDARQKRIWVNAADQPAACDFYMPATVRRDHVVLAIGTGGASPGLVQHLKRRAKDILPDQVGPFAALLDEIRKQLKADLPDEPHRRLQIMNTLSDETALDAFTAHGPKAIRDALADLLAGKTVAFQPAKSPKGSTPKALFLRMLLMAAVLATSAWALAHATRSPKLLHKGHILAALHAAGGILFAALVALNYLRTERRLRTHALALFDQKSASLETLHHWIRRGFVFAATALSVSLPLGLIYAHQIGIKQWMANTLAQPKFLAAFVVWGLYLFAVALAVRPKFRGRQCAQLALAGFTLTLFLLLASWLSANH